MRQPARATLAQRAKLLIPLGNTYPFNKCVGEILKHLAHTGFAENFSAEEIFVDLCSVESLMP